MVANNSYEIVPNLKDTNLDNDNIIYNVDIINRSHGYKTRFPNCEMNDIIEFSQLALEAERDVRIEIEREKIKAQKIAEENAKKESYIKDQLFYKYGVNNS